jgi:hypothetical protein
MNTNTIEMQNAVILGDDIIIQCDSPEEAAMLELIITGTDFKDDAILDDAANTKAAQDVESDEAFHVDEWFLPLEVSKMVEQFRIEAGQDHDPALQWTLIEEESVEVLVAYRDLMMAPLPVHMAAFLKEIADLLYVSSAFLNAVSVHPDMELDASPMGPTLYAQAMDLIASARANFLDNSDVQELMETVHASNMSKLEGDIEKDPVTGKVLKSVYYEPADLTHLSLIATAQMFLYQAAVTL